jgi:hypothetical protein
LDMRLGGPKSWSGRRLEEKYFASVRDWTLVFLSVVRHYGELPQLFFMTWMKQNLEHAENTTWKCIFWRKVFKFGESTALWLIWKAWTQDRFTSCLSLPHNCITNL